MVNATGSGESGDVVIKAVDSLSMDAASSISIDAGASVDITGANSVDIVGSSLDFQAVNGSADFFAENGGDADVFTLGVSYQVKWCVSGTLLQELLLYSNTSIFFAASFRVEMSILAPKKAEISTLELKVVMSQS